MIKLKFNTEPVSVYGIFGAVASTLSGSFFLIFLTKFCEAYLKKLEIAPNCAESGILTSRGSLVRIH